MRIVLSSVLAVIGTVNVLAETTASHVTIAPVPEDPHELAGDNVQISAAREARAAARALFERAREMGDLHLKGTPPFRVKLAFTAGGDVAFTGNGEITETWLSYWKWRDDQNLGTYSQTRKREYATFDDKPVTSVPLRLHMLRRAFFWITIGDPSTDTIRSASAEWNGNPVTCLPFSNKTDLAGPPGRHWEESEYCVDNSSGLLQIYSEAPGTYMVFGYGRNLQFHGRGLPDHIVGYVAGAAVLDARLASIVDASPVDSSLLKPVEGAAHADAANTFDWRLFDVVYQGPVAPGVVKVVNVHATADTEGNVVEEEVSAASDPALARAALEEVRRFQEGRKFRCSDMYVNVRFMPGFEGAASINSGVN